MNFLVLIEMTGKSFVLAAFASISQYIQMKLVLPKFDTKSSKKDKPTMKDEFMKSFRLQMKYGLPIFVFFISYTISAAVALYWATSNLFSIGHELYVRKKAQEVNTDSSPS